MWLPGGDRKAQTCIYTEVEVTEMSKTQHDTTIQYLQVLSLCIVNSFAGKETCSFR